MDKFAENPINQMDEKAEFVEVIFQSGRNIGSLNHAKYKAFFFRWANTKD